MVNLAELAFLQWQAEEELAHQRVIIRARNYHEGKQGARLTDRLRAFLTDSTSDEMLFRLNVCRQIVRAVEERLIVKGFDTTEGGNKPASAWAWQVWQADRMDAKQGDVHEGVLVEGEYFVIVDWDANARRTRFVPHPRYTDSLVGGDGFGCKAFYQDDDPNQPMLFASKRWVENLGGGKAQQRMTLYHPDRIKRYEGNGVDWKLLEEVSWVDVLGQPLGIPVIHFRNPSLRPEAWEAIPLQKAINKLLIDTLAASDLTAFRVFVALGWIPTSDGQPPKADGSNRLKIEPGQIIGTTKPQGEASFAAVDGADFTSQLDAIQQLVQWVAIVTDTPASRFAVTRQVAAEGTLKQQNEPLLTKIRKRQTLLGNGWEDCFTIALRLANTFGGQSLDETVQFSTQWADAQTRNELETLQALAIKREKLGVPVSQIWREAGYTQAQIDLMMSESKAASVQPQA